MYYAPLLSPKCNWRTALTVAVVVAALLGMGVVFWERDLRYSLPTPRPADLVQIPLGTVVTLPEPISRALARDDRAVLLHFYNPECPCSRFNREHVQWLMNRFGKQVQFVSIVEAETMPKSGAGIDTPNVLDADGRIARQLGVYSTPQAVLLDPQRRLRFCGNFNTSRYCTARQTQFARLAIEAMLHDDGFVLEPDAGIAYGCPLPDQECHVENR